MGPTKKPEDAIPFVRSAGFRPSQPLLGAITAWMALQEETPSLSQAIARLVELGLTHADQDRQKLRAREMAGDTIDRMGDATTTADDRAIRKQDLLDGPKEFGRVRIDRAKRGKPIQE